MSKRGRIIYGIVLAVLTVLAVVWAVWFAAHGCSETRGWDGWHPAIHYQCAR